ncbi:hypothetical protein ACS0PU_004130 [Formica fusca]
MFLCLSLWCYMLLFVALSSESGLNFETDEQDDNSTVRYQLSANIVRNYDDERNLIWYNSNENSTNDNGDMQLTYRINSTSNNRENDNLIFTFLETQTAENHENDSQIPLESHFMSQEIHKNLKRTEGENSSTSHDPYKNYNRDNNKNNVVPYKMCDNITCIRLCCPFGNHLVDGKCVAEENNFIFLENMYGYIDDLLQNENEKVNELFLLVVHDPCQKTRHYLLDLYDNVFLIDGSLYLPYSNAIIESTSYCLAIVDQNIFAVNVCFEIMKKIMNNTINHNKSAIFPLIEEEINEENDEANQKQE